MVRILIASVAAGFIGLGILTAGTAQADMCGNHGTGAGQIYKAACANGPGGAGPTVRYWDKKAGHFKFDRKSNVVGETRDKEGKSIIH